jgi:hypothetical protein
MLTSLVFSVLASSAFANMPAGAQGGEAEDMFAELVLDRGYNADDARRQVAAAFGQAVATDIAVYWCSPEADEGCDGSVVLKAWLDFEDLIDDDYSADDAREELADNYDESLAAALAVFWCSPEPGDGCSGSDVARVWQEFDDRLLGGRGMKEIRAELGPQYGQALVDGLAAYACGDLECADAEPEQPQVDPEQPQMDEPAPRAEQSTQRSTKKNKYAKKRGTGRRRR